MGTKIRHTSEDRHILHDELPDPVTYDQVLAACEAGYFQNVQDGELGAFYKILAFDCFEGRIGERITSYATPEDGHNRAHERGDCSLQARTICQGLRQGALWTSVGAGVFRRYKLMADYLWGFVEFHD